MSSCTWCEYILDFLATECSIILQLRQCAEYMLERMTEMARSSKWFRMIGIVCFLICFGLGNKTLSATSWVELEPEEVEEKAEIVVLETYDFSEKSKGRESVFEGYPFYVTDVYKGATKEIITVGIDGFDVGWATEFQENDGSFLLFLKKLDKAAFLTPVGGPKDRKSTRLNSSHVDISYAVFCLKKKKI